VRALETSRARLPDREQRLTVAREQLLRVGSEAYLGELSGTIGKDPLLLQRAERSA
jgi:hypothetical protein